MRPIGTTFVVLCGFLVPSRATFFSWRPAEDFAIDKKISEALSQKLSAPELSLGDGTFPGIGSDQAVVLVDPSMMKHIDFDMNFIVSDAMKLDFTEFLGVVGDLDGKETEEEFALSAGSMSGVMKALQQVLAHLKHAPSEAPSSGEAGLSKRTIGIKLLQEALVEAAAVQAELFAFETTRKMPLGMIERFANTIGTTLPGLAATYPESLGGVDLQRIVNLEEKLREFGALYPELDSAHELRDVKLIKDAPVTTEEPPVAPDAEKPPLSLAGQGVFDMIVSDANPVAALRDGLPFMGGLKRAETLIPIPEPLGQFTDFFSKNQITSFSSKETFELGQLEEVFRLVGEKGAAIVPTSSIIPKLPIQGIADGPIAIVPMKILESPEEISEVLRGGKVTSGTADSQDIVELVKSGGIHTMTLDEALKVFPEVVPAGFLFETLQSVSKGQSGIIPASAIPEIPEVVPQDDLAVVPKEVLKKLAIPTAQETVAKIKEEKVVEKIHEGIAGTPFEEVSGALKDLGNSMQQINEDPNTLKATGKHARQLIVALASIQLDGGDAAEAMSSAKKIVDRLEIAQIVADSKGSADPGLLKGLDKDLERLGDDLKSIGIHAPEEKPPTPKL